MKLRCSTACTWVPALLAVVLAAPVVSSADRITVVRSGEILVSEGPEPVGGVGAGDPFQVSATYDPDDLSGVGFEVLLFDGIALLDGSLEIAIGTALFTELDTGGATTQLLFQDGELVGYEYDAPFTTPLGAEYFLSLSGTGLVQSPSFVPFDVEETTVEGVIPEPAPALLLLGGLLALSLRPAAKPR